MKILFLSDLNTIHTKRWVNALSNHGFQIMVFGISDCRNNDYESMNNVIVRSASGEIVHGSSLGKLRYLRSLKALKKAYYEFSPDIVHAHYASSYGLLGSLLKHKPFLISVWGTDVFSFPKESPFKKMLLKRNLRKADRIFSTGQIMAAETKKYTSKKVNVVPFGVDLETFVPGHREYDSQALTFGIVKTLEESYGIKYLVQAFKLLLDKYPDSGHRLIIVGKGSQSENLKKLVADLDLEDKVEFPGFVKHDEIPDQFNRMDVVVVPSIVEESFGVAAIEASACEKPVIVSDVGGLPEVILDKKTGLVVEPKNAEKLFRKMDYFVTHPEQIDVFGKAGRQNVRDNYNWQENVQTMILHYQDVLG